MSRTQDALFRNDYDCAKPAAAIAEMCEAPIQERSDDASQKNTPLKSHRGRSRRGPVIWIFPKRPSKNGRPADEKITQRRSTGAPDGEAAAALNRSEPGRISHAREAAKTIQPGQNPDESLAAQIQHFQERADLRKCLLPGMLGKISRNACEGWQKQAVSRNSKMMAKVKLDTCRGCPHCLESRSASRNPIQSQNRSASPNAEADCIS